MNKILELLDAFTAVIDALKKLVTYCIDMSVKHDKKVVSDAMKEATDSNNDKKEKLDATKDIEDKFNDFC